MGDKIEIINQPTGNLSFNAWFYLLFLFCYRLAEVFRLGKYAFELSYEVSINIIILITITLHNIYVSGIQKNAVEEASAVSGEDGNNNTNLEESNSKSNAVVANDFIETSVNETEPDVQQMKIDR